MAKKNKKNKKSAATAGAAGPGVRSPAMPDDATERIVRVLKEQHAAAELSAGHALRMVLVHGKRELSQFNFVRADPKPSAEVEEPDTPFTLVLFDNDACCAAPDKEIATRRPFMGLLICARNLHDDYAQETMDHIDDVCGSGPDDQRAGRLVLFVKPLRDGPLLCSDIELPLADSAVRVIMQQHGMDIVDGQCPAHALLDAMRTRPELRGALDTIRVKRLVEREDFCQLSNKYPDYNIKYCVRKAEDKAAKEELAAAWQEHDARTASVPIAQ